MRKIKIAGLLVFFIVYSGYNFVYSMGKINKKTQSEQVVKLKKVNNELPTLVDLGADKCRPCKMMEPILEELKVTYSGKMNVVFYDVWKDSSKATEYGIRMIPTQIFLDKVGKELFRHSGFISKKEILEQWNKLGYPFQD